MKKRQSDRHKRDTETDEEETVKEKHTTYPGLMMFMKFPFLPLPLAPSLFL
jgi:hypothetical protein